MIKMLVVDTEALARSGSRVIRVSARGIDMVAAGGARGLGRIAAREP